MFIWLYAAAALGGTLVNVHDTMVPTELCVRQSTHLIERDLALEAQFARINKDTPLIMPRYYWIVLCRNVTLDTHHKKLVAATNHATATDAHPALLGFDLIHEIFQHDIINGAAMIGMAWNWLQNNTNVRVVTTPMLVGVLRPALGTRVVARFAQSTTYAELFIATPVWRGEDGLPPPQQPTWDIYASHAFEHFTTRFFAAEPDRPKSRIVLYLDRAPPLKRTAVFYQCRDVSAACNCSALKHESALAVLRDAVIGEGFRFEVFKHAGLASDQLAFRAAAAVVGPHGGAFSNSIWMRPGRKLIEINIAERLCFVGTALAAGVVYYRYQPLVFRNYYALQAMDVDVEHFARYVADVIAGRALSAGNSCAAVRIR